jgi:hypothetical protein
MAAEKDFKPVFERLRGILQPYETALHLDNSSEEGYALSTHPFPESLKMPQNPLFFAGVTSRKSYVSFYLMPVYIQPALLEGISPELKKRMQGKSCFNFKVVDDVLFEELARMTEQGFLSYKQAGFVTDPA